jgi:hypothetical protein
VISGLLIRWGRRVRRLFRAVIGYRALARQYETDLAAAEATIGKLSAEVTRQVGEYAALEVRAAELIGRIRDLERINAELHASIDAAFDAGALYYRDHVEGRGAFVPRGWSEN